MKITTVSKLTVLMALLGAASTSWVTAGNQPDQAGQSSSATQAGAASRDPSRDSQEMTRDSATTKDQYHQQNSYSQDRYQNRYQQSAATQVAPVQKINKASGLIGMTVKNDANEKLGTIKDIVVDLNSGRVAYAVLATDPGVLKTEKYHAVPLDAFRPGSDGNSLTLNANKDKLARAEGFDRNTWPTIGTASWGAQPFWEQRTGTDYQNRSADQYRQDQLRNDRESRTDQERNDMKDRNVPADRPTSPVQQTTPEPQ